MPAEIKKQQLLGSLDPKKKRKPQQKQKKQAQQAKEQTLAQSQANVAAQAARAKAKKKGGVVKKIVQSFFLVVIIGLIIVPKPQLLSYKKLGLTATSIYIPGWFGSPGKLLDSPQKVVIEKQLGLVYLCFGEINPDKQLKEQCNRFQFVEQKGLFAAFSHYRNNPQQEINK